MDSRDKFLFHKTTNRSYFNKELTARPDCDDLIFWNERKEITESSIANLVIQIAGKLWTPPQSSGLLAGTLREELLAQGKIQERVISMDELRQASALFLINSVHRWKRATLID